MRLSLRFIIGVLNSVDGQLDSIDNKFRENQHLNYRDRLLFNKRKLREAIRGLSELVDDMIDNNID